MIIILSMSPNLLLVVKAPPLPEWSKCGCVEEIAESLKQVDPSSALHCSLKAVRHVHLTVVPAVSHGSEVQISDETEEKVDKERLCTKRYIALIPG